MTTENTSIVVEGITPVVPVDNLQVAVAQWSALLGVPPTFVDGSRWAQFDVAGKRVALSGTDREVALAHVMIKVRDLSAARAAALANGLVVGEVVLGPHERRCLVTSPQGWVAVYYAAHDKPR